MPVVKAYSVDFKTIKQQFTLEQVLQHYGVELAGARASRRGKCPLHHGDNPTSFSVNLEKNAWHCFGCGESGNQLDLIAKMEECSIKEAASKAVDWFNLDTGRSDPPAKRRPSPTKREHKKPAPVEQGSAPEPSESPPAENKPLGFTLKLDSEHPYLADRGLTPATIEAFGVGYCTRGTMKGRIAIPIRNRSGEIVGYAGRWADDGDPPKGEGKYKLPKGFHKGLELFGADQVSAPADSLVIVEGFFPCMRLSQLGIPAVATMGSSVTDDQAKRIVELTAPQAKIVLLYDEDDTGQEGREKAAAKLANERFVRILRLPQEGMQPDNLSDEEILTLIPREAHGEKS